MIDHHRQVPVPFAIGDLVDPDPHQPLERIEACAGVVGDTLDDRAYGPSRDAHQLGDGLLRGMDRKPGDLVLKPAGHPHVMARPRHGSDRGPVDLAGDPRRISLEEGAGGALAQIAPPALPHTLVIAR